MSRHDYEYDYDPGPAAVIVFLCVAFSGFLFGAATVGLIWWFT